MSDDIIFELSQADVQFEQPDIIAEFTPEGKDGRSIHPMGQWSDSVPYSTLDLVSYQGASYIAMKNVPAGTLPTNTQYWMLNANVEGVEVIWGSITGELSDQEDLQQALDLKANTEDLGDLASKDKVDYETDIDNLPELGDLASKDKVDYDTDIDNLPELGALADHDTVDYETEVENKPELGDLASKDKVDYETDIDNLPTLGDLAEKDKVDYETDIDNLPELGDLASKNKANWNTDLENVPQTFPPSDHNHDGRYYTISEMNTALASKANSTDVYTKSQSDILLSAKANSADVYTKSQANELLDEKFDKDPDSTLTGSILSFEAAVENAIKDLTVEINPVQDLHGQANPYPAGGSKNLLDVSEALGTQNGLTFAKNADGSIEITGTSESSVYRLANTNLPLTPSTNYSANGMQANIKLRFRLYDSNNTLTRELYATNIDLNFTTSTSEVKADVTILVTSSTNGTVYPMLRLSSITDASFAPYSNICPISGWSEVNVWDDPKHGGLINWNQKITNGDFANGTTGWIAASGTLSANNGELSVQVGGEWNNDARQNLITTAGHKYLIKVTAKADSSIDKITFGQFATSANANVIFDITQTYTKYSAFIEPTVDGEVIRFSLVASGLSRIGSKYYLKNAMLFDLTQMFGAGNEPSTVAEFNTLFPKDYYDYNSGTITCVSAVNDDPYSHVTVDLNGTKYGGLLNVTTGELTVTKGIISDLSQLTWIQHSARTTTYYATSATLNLKPYNNMISSALKGVPASISVGSMPDNSVRSDQTADNYIYVNSTIASNVPSFTASMSGVQLVYELAFPVTIQLSSEQITTIIGQNNLWCDSGDSTIILRTGAGKMAYQDSVSYSDLTEKPDPDNYYTKSEVESLINHSGVVAEKDASGSIAEFETNLAENLSRLSVSIDPVQDLHGYDSPWPAGGGKNLLLLTLAILKSNNVQGTWSDNVYTLNNVTFTISTNTEGYVTKIVLNGTASASAPLNLMESGVNNDWIGKVVNGAPSGSSGSTSYIGGWNSTDNTGIGVYDFGSGMTLPDTLQDKSFRIYIAVPNGSANSNREFYPMIRDSAQSATFAPYSNVSPISGFSSANITRAGKNLMGMVTATMSANNITVTKNSDGSVTAYSTGATITQSFDLLLMKVKAGSYTLNGLTGGSGSTYRIRIRDDGNTSNLAYCENGEDATITVPNDTQIRVQLFVYTGASIDKIFYPMVRFASVTDSSYEAPHVENVTVSLGNTYYGAQLDAVAGTLTVTHRYTVLDGTQILYKHSSTLHNAFFMYLDANNLPACASTADGTVGQFSYYKLGKLSNADCNAFVGSNTIQFRNDALTSKDEANAYLTANPLQVVYPLATPVTVQLTPAQVQALVGKNYVWADTGDVIKLSYYDNDTDSAIDDVKEIIGDYTETMVAPRNLNANEFIVVNKHLYKVTANVASGSNLVIGTNVVETTVAEQLTYLLSQI